MAPSSSSARIAAIRSRLPYTRVHTAVESKSWDELYLVRNNTCQERCSVIIEQYAKPISLSMLGSRCESCSCAAAHTGRFCMTITIFGQVRPLLGRYSVHLHDWTSLLRPHAGFWFIHVPFTRPSTLPPTTLRSSKFPNPI